MIVPDDAPDLDAAWEPEHLRLRVGERVRVRLSGECTDWDHTPGDGALGVVRDIHICYPVPSHSHYVRFDVRCRGFVSDYYARAELTRIPPDTA